VRYGMVYRIGGLFIVGLGIGVRSVVVGTANHKPVLVVLGIVLLGLCVPILIGVARVWRIARALSAASQGVTPDGAGPPSPGSRGFQRGGWPSHW
jgi:hypothetical protein